MRNERSKENKLKQIKSCVTKEDILHFIPRKKARDFEKNSKKDGKSTIPIMTYGDTIIFVRTECDFMPNIPLSKFNFTSGTFDKKWGPNHKTIVLTPNHSSIRKVEFEIEGIDVRKMKLLPDRKGDVLEDTAKVKITRHYRFALGRAENIKDTHTASPGQRKARRFPGEIKRKFR